MTRFRVASQIDDDSKMLRYVRMHELLEDQGLSDMQFGGGGQGRGQGAASHSNINEDILDAHAPNDPMKQGDADDQLGNDNQIWAAGNPQQHQLLKTGSTFSRAALFRYQREIQKVLFEVNYLALNSLHGWVPSSAYILILIVEFMQMAFFIFSGGVVVKNEFKTVISTTDSIFFTSLQSQAKSLNNIDYSFILPSYELVRQNNSNNDSLKIAEDLQTLRPQDYFQLANFQLYSFQNDNASSGENISASFLLMYCIFAGMFFGLIIIVSVLSKRIFSGQKTTTNQQNIGSISSEKGSQSFNNLQDQHKSGFYVAFKITSLMLVLFMTVFQIPFFTLLLQGYQCEEDASIQFAFSIISCNSISHKLLVFFSTITLILYFAFLLVQIQLLTSTNPDCDIPWGSPRSNRSLYRTLLRFLISCLFVFYKDNEQHATFMICFGTLSFAIMALTTRSGSFVKEVAITSSFLDIMLLLLFLTIGSVQMSSENNDEATINVSVLALVVLTAAMGSIVCNKFLSEWSLMRNVTEENPMKERKSPVDKEAYILDLFKIINEDSRESYIIMRGVFANHLEVCMSRKCLCLDLAETLDDYKKYKKIKLKHMPNIMNINGIEDDFMTNNDSVLISNHQDFSNTTSVQPKFNMSQRHLEKGKLMSFRKKEMDDIQAIEPHADNHTIMQFTSIRDGGKKDTAQGFQHHIGGISMRTTLNQDPSQYERQKSLLIQEIAATVGFDVPLSEQNGKNNNYSQSYTSAAYQQVEKKQTKKHFFKYLSLLLSYTSFKHPEYQDIRILNARILREKLLNCYKAAFELMSCSQSGQSNLSQKFEIFRGYLRIQEKIALVHQHASNNNIKNDFIDIVRIVEYEKTAQTFMKHEFLAVRAALGFWRELLSPEFNSNIVRQRGMEITRCYRDVQDISDQLRSMQKNDIKFLFRYGLFLVNIINNEFEGLQLFREAQGLYQAKLHSRISIQQGGGDSASGQIKGNGFNEASFGENSGTGIIIIQATASRFGEIIHSNDEIEHLLGYSKRELLHRNVNMLVPKVLQNNHQKFLKRYLDTGKSRFIDKQQQLFAINKAGTIQILNVVIKIHPNIQGRILFAGLFQRATSFNSLPAPKHDFSKLDEHYIITDKAGIISNITDSLFAEIGLHHKMFPYNNDSNFNALVDFRVLCPSIMEADVEAQLQGREEGLILEFDTTYFIDRLEVENLSLDELREARLHKGKHLVYVQLLKQELGPEKLNMNIYRLYVLDLLEGSRNDLSATYTGNNNNDSNGGGGSNEGSPKQINRQISNDEGRFEEEKRDFDPVQNQNNNNAHQQQQNNSMLTGGGRGYFSISEESGAFQTASVASNDSMQSVSINNIVSNFKSSLNERKTPRSIVLLNILFISSLLALMVLYSVAYSVTVSGISKLMAESKRNLFTQERSLQVVQLSSNMRSLIDVAQEAVAVEYDQYQITRLNRYSDRYEYVARLFPQEEENLNAVQQFLAQQRDNKNEMSQNEFKPIELFRLDDNNRVTKFTVSFRIAMFMFLNEILSLNTTEREGIQFTPEMLQVPPIENYTFSENQQEGGSPSATQKSAYFVMANGLRNIRINVHEATRFSKGNGASSDSFLIIMILGILITTMSVALMMYQIWNIEHLQTDILSLLALLQIPLIKEVYNRNLDYMHELIEGTVFGSKVRENKLHSATANSSAWDDSSFDGESAQESPTSSPQLQQKLSASKDKDSLNQVGSASKLGQMNGEGISKSQLLLPRQSVNNLAVPLGKTTKGLVQSKRRSSIAGLRQLNMPRQSMNAQSPQDVAPGGIGGAGSGGGGANVIGNALYEWIIKRSYAEMQKMAQTEKHNLEVKKSIKKIKNHVQLKTIKEKASQNSSSSSSSDEEEMEEKPKAKAVAVEEKKQNPPPSPSSPEDSIGKLFGNDKEEKLKKVLKIFQTKPNLKVSSENLVDDKRNSKMESNVTFEKDQSKDYLNHSEAIEEVTESSEEDSETQSKSDSYKKWKVMKKQQSTKTRGGGGGQKEIYENETSLHMLMETSAPVSALPFEFDDPETIERRKIKFTKTLKSTNRCRNTSTLALSFILCSYFVIVNMYHAYFEEQIDTLQGTIPTLYNRFRYIMLAYGLLRERLLFNNSLSSFEMPPEDFDSTLGLDQYYFHLSLDNEVRLTQLKAKHPGVVESLVDLFMDLDSDRFCTRVIGETNNTTMDINYQALSIDTTIHEESFKKYQNIIGTLILGCRAAYSGDVETLMKLRAKQVDLSEGDYDFRTPLHYAVKGNHTEAVRYLLEQGVQVNPEDRWFSTPLDFASSNKEIQALLKKKGGVNSADPGMNKPSGLFSLSDHQIRLFYAAFNNDVGTAELMLNIGVDTNFAIDLDGRTPMHVAAAMGSYATLQFLTYHGADLTVIDSRELCPMDEAEGNGFISLHNFIDNIISRSIATQSCSIFNHGLFKHGFQSAIAQFQKKYNDLYLQVVSPDKTYADRLRLLRWIQTPKARSLLVANDALTRAPEEFTNLQIYFQVQELYMHRVIKTITNKIEDAFSTFSRKYSESTMIIFLCFLSVQLATLLFLRGRLLNKMRSDIFESRGILNLIPNHVIDHNKQAVEAIIKKLKN